MYYPLDDFAEPGIFVLQDADRFHSISHSGEIPLADGTAVVLVIFVVRRASGVFDMYIVNKFFRADTTVNRSLMSKTDIAPADIDQTVATTAATFAQTIQLIRWDELDLRRIDGQDAQIAAIKKWGKLRSVRVET